ncbi:MAG: glucose 1-dehydrogenase [Clostridiales Family XIII bacterium]|jgi:gluconate 5-dehydrogenase|nr:glucose 1-dehydrogenase [Clostridiales Family XIII bacterium]
MAEKAGNEVREMIASVSSAKNAFDLSGKTALITGGGRGLGAAIAVAMAECGADIAVFGRSDTSGTVERVQKLGVKGKGFLCDVSRLEDVRRATGEAYSEFGNIDVLVNNAGISCVSELLDMDDALSDWYRVTGVDLNGTVHMTYHVAKQMRAGGKGGSIINISSMAGSAVIKTQAMSPYCCSKAAVNHFTRCMAWELGKHDIRVNAIAPGFVNTDLSDQIPKDHLRHIFEQSPLSRFGEPAEIGTAAVYLASPAAAWITGAVLTVDGGYTLSC